MRTLVLSLMLLPLAASALASQQPGALTPFAAAQAEAHLRDQLPCLGCHQLAAQGGMTAPTLDGVGARLSASAIRAVITDPQRERPGSVMPRVPMRRETLDLIVRFLAGLGGREGASGVGRGGIPVIAAPPAGRRDGAGLYATYCAACHGTRGDGDGPNAGSLPVRPTPHSSADYMRHRSDDALYDAIAAGGRIMGRSPLMPPYGETLTPLEIRSLVAHLRELCGCAGPDWSRR